MKLENLKGLYIAHRGIHNEYIIENTIPAFSKALEKNIPIELDLHILKDGNIVVYHDHNLNRLMKINRAINSYTYDDLSKFVFPNTNVHIPLFDEVLDLIKGKVLIVIEIKETTIISYSKYCKKIVSILENYSGTFVIKSFDIRIVNWFLKNTDYTTGLLISGKKQSFYNRLMNSRITLSLLKPNFISVDYKILDSKLVQNYRKNYPVLVWTIKNWELLDKVKDKADSYLVEKISFDDNLI